MGLQRWKPKIVQLCGEDGGDVGLQRLGKDEKLILGLEKLGRGILG